MRLTLPKAQLPRPEFSMRRAGYGIMRNHKTDDTSFVKRLHGDLYPRFHLYVEDAGENWSLNLHLDQRAPVYAGQTAHAGEYDGAVVETEMERIKMALTVSQSNAEKN